MFTGIALYNCEKIAPVSAFEMGKSFFSTFSIPITGAGYYCFLKDGDHQNDHDLFDIRLHDLEKRLKSGEITAFRIYAENSAQPWTASFGYMTDQFGSFFHISAQFPASEGADLLLPNFVKNVFADADFPYGIMYRADDVIDAFYYATGDNFVKLFSYENPTKWQEEIPGLYAGAERYTASMLRMIYPYNLVNNQHMNLKVQGVSLKAWITSNPSRGTLTLVNENLWLWKVEDEDLDQINKECGEAGILISWQPVEKKSKRRFLP